MAFDAAWGYKWLMGDLLGGQEGLLGTLKPKAIWQAMGAYITLQAPYYLLFVGHIWSYTGYRLPTFIQ